MAYLVLLHHHATILGQEKKSWLLCDATASHNIMKPPSFKSRQAMGNLTQVKASISKQSVPITIVSGTQLHSFNARVLRATMEGKPSSSPCNQKLKGPNKDPSMRPFSTNTLELESPRDLAKRCARSP